MKVKAFKITTQILTGFVTIILFSMFLGLVSYTHTVRLSKSARDLYNHPFQISREVRELRINLLESYNNIHLFTRNNDPQAILDLKWRTDSLDQKMYALFDSIYARYLGPEQDVDRVYSSFHQLELSKAEIFRLIDDGNSKEAIKSLAQGSRYELQFKETTNKILVLSDFANAKADQFFLNSQKEARKLGLRTLFILVTIILMSITVLSILTRRIRKPLEELLWATEEFGKGDLEARSSYTMNNEFGVLSAAFNRLALSIADMLSLAGDASSIASESLKENDLREFCRNLLSEIMTRIEAQGASIFFVNKNGSEFILYESIGLQSSGKKTFSIDALEGEFGRVITKKEIIVLKNVPDDSRMLFPAVAGIYKPKEIITIPISSNGNVVSIISMGSLKPFGAASLLLVEEVWPMLTARINGVLSYNKIVELSTQLEDQNRELESQSSELLKQADELMELNHELEIQKKELEEAHRLKSIFLSNMSHELRTPLNSIIALSGVISKREGRSIGKEEIKYVDIIEKNGKYLLTLINNILEISRIESGKEEVSYSVTSIAEIIESSVEMLGHLAIEKKLKLVTNLPSDLPVIFSDKAKCRHIIENVISNAVKFTEAGSVTISGKISSKELSIMVSDTGIGIAEKHLSIIFDEFRQVDEEYTRKYGGSGLGLSISKKYMDMIGGRLEVKSKDRAGSTFTLVFPISSGSDMIQSHDDSMKQNFETRKPGEDGGTLLLVEDSEPTIIQIREMLNEEGYLVRVARNGKEALTELGMFLPDGIILDLMMPEIDGFEVLKQIRAKKRSSKIPVLILTAKQVTREELSFLTGNGILQLVQKGAINKTDFLRLISRLIQTKK